MLVMQRIVRVRQRQLNLAAPNDISGRAEARVVKFCIQVDYMESWLSDDRAPLKWAWLGSHDTFSISTPFFKFCPQLYLFHW